MVSAFQSAFGFIRESPSLPESSLNNSNNNVPENHITDTGPNLMELLCRDENGNGLENNANSHNTGIIDWEAVDVRLDKHPEDCMHRLTKNGELSSSAAAPFPLFVAITKRAPPHIIEKIINSYPPAVRELQSPTGLTALYLAVAKGCTQKVIQMLLDIYPQAASKPAFNGSIALHSVENVETAQLLLDVYPEGIGELNYIGYLPLHRAAYSAWTSADVVNLFIQYGIKHNVGGPHGGGGVFVSTANGITPLSAICDVITHKGASEGLWSKFCHITSAAAMAKGFTSNNSNVKEREEEMMDNSTMTTNDQQKEEIYPSRVLQNVIRLDCPNTIIQFAHARNPIECTQCDEFGRSPLTYACMGGGGDCGSSSGSPSSSGGIAVASPLFSQNRRNAIIDMLIDAYPQAASKSDCHGRLPLHYYVASISACHLRNIKKPSSRSGASSGDAAAAVAANIPSIPIIRDDENEYSRNTVTGSTHASNLRTIMALIKAEPRALETVDVCTKLYPFMLAAAAATTNPCTTTASSYVQKISSTTASWLSSSAAVPAARSADSPAHHDDNNDKSTSSDGLDVVYCLLRASPWLITQALERDTLSLSSSHQELPSPGVSCDTSSSNHWNDPSCSSSTTGTPRQIMIVPVW
eukprot:CAMPEP_0195284854 /NCGR_PEP_ID=MMETSP0707-20130614/2902_1 /TAXON_ID=33640 /ORGANISM="Asterionellopsis glacialis, Strain CCMP134" /LENGTH=638 /DNA_ID=CAMNT_0040344255 /DNA_START=48 /DNA_END=1961 /DNA_ORIENTATION=+